MSNDSCRIRGHNWQWVADEKPCECCGRIMGHMVCSRCGKTINDL